MKTQRQVLGARGEDAAANYLVQRGYEVIDRNWRCQAGELDLVVRSASGKIIGVEVKTRSSQRYGAGFEAVNPAKFRRLNKLMVLWAQRHAVFLPRLQIDVLEVYALGEDWSIEHLQDVSS